MIIAAFGDWRWGVKKILVLVVVAVLASFGLGYAFAAGKTYQVTGPVLEVRPDAVVVQKGSDKWEIARNGSTKVTGDLKVGARVTIQYTMTATEIEVKPAAATKKKK
jgi:hypothetical protein